MKIFSIYKAGFYFLTACIALILSHHVVGMAMYSIHDGNYADSAFLYYLSWLIDQHHVAPFRDILETNYPGTYWAYGAITRIFGYTDKNYATANLCLLAMLSAMSFMFIRKISVTAAIIGPLYFAEYYLSNPTLGLQREYLAMFPIVGALLLADRPSITLFIKCFLIGLCFAAAAAIKPPLAIGLPLVLWYVEKKPLQELSCLRRIISTWGAAAGGFLSGAAICLLWLLATDTLQDFITITTEYLPLYLQLNLQQHSEDASLLHMPGMVEFFNILLPPYFESVPILLAVIFIALEKNAAKLRMAALLSLLVIAYRFYVFFSIKNFDYHYIPAKYFVFFAGSIAMTLLPAYVPWPAKIVHIGWLAFIVNVLLQSNHDLTYGDDAASRIHATTRNELVNFLREHKQQHDSVQIRVQGTYGPVFPAMLDLKIPLAIPRFPLNQVFYHHIHNPYIISIKKDYMQALRTTLPTYIIDDNGFDFYKSISGDHAFSEYDEFIRDNYHPVFDNLQRAEAPDQFIVYQRNP